MISFFGAIFAGYVAVGNYTTNSAYTCSYIYNHSNCQVMVV